MATVDEVKFSNVHHRLTVATDTAWDSLRLGGLAIRKGRGPPLLTDGQRSFVLEIQEPKYHKEPECLPRQNNRPQTRYSCVVLLQSSLGYPPASSSSPGSSECSTKMLAKTNKTSPNGLITYLLHRQTLLSVQIVRTVQAGGLYGTDNLLAWGRVVQKTGLAH
ncbi:hypothetical protein EVAR_2259_1 [Eumeta japonica]|uniref:Uncharacterized protein n=1 Tax=Eumeta variegata TaxID=151549 RepID=A0A4C1SFQ2_EUMVA|nr:hypothetical protein EVAR_2259_1 [Eumeta japonica]